jgi:two-component system, cell cycle sensor histidine kinase and response regulator CckA
MAQEKDSKGKFSGLRTGAQETLSGKPSDMEEISALSPEEAQRLVYELRVHQIELEMQNEDMRNSQIELEELKDRYLDLYDFAPVGYLTLNEKGLILDANLTAVRLLEVERQRLTEMFFSRFVTQEFGDAYYLYLRQVFETQSKQTCEVKLAREDGTHFYAQLESIAVQDKTGRSNRVRTILSDISERKRAEEALQESERRYDAFLNSTTDLAFLKDEGFRYVMANKANQEFFGKTEAEIIGKTDFELMPPSAAENCRRSDVEALGSGGIVVTEEESGGRVFETKKFLVKLENGQTGLGGLIREVTDRNKAEEALRESDTRYRNLVENIEDLICTHDHQGNLLFVNQASAKVLGYAPAELIGTNLRSYLAPEVRDQFDAYMAAIKREGRASGLMLVQTKSGEKRIWEYRNTLHKESPGVLIVHGIARDITDREKAEATIRQQLDFLQQLIDTIPTPIFYKDVEGRYLGCNTAFESDTGMSRANIVGKTIFDVLAPDLAQIYHDQDLSLLRNPGVQQGEALRQDAAGNLHEVIFTKATFLDFEGNVAGMVGVIFDITDRKKTEEALRQSEEKYRSIFDNSIEGIFQSTPDGRLITVNMAYARMFGYDSPDEMISEVTDIASQLYANPAERDEVKRRFDDPVPLTNYEVAVFRKDGAPIWVSFNARAIRDESGRILYYEGMTENISPRKEAEEALRKNEEKYRSVVENMQDVFYRTDLQGTITMVSASGPEMIGYESVDQIIGLNVGRDFYKNSDERDRMLALLREKGAVSNLEVELVRSDGNSIIVSTNSHIYYDKSGQPLGVEGVFTDITARKRAENALRESEEKYRILVENANEGVFVAQDGVIRFLNARTAEIVGYGEEELISKPFTEFIHPDDREMVIKSHFRRLRGEEFPGRYPFRILTKDGKSKWVEIEVAVIQWEGRPATLVLMSDVTERKQAEEALKESEEWYRSIVEDSFDGIFVQKGPKIVYANTVLYKMLGYSARELEGMDHWLIYQADDQQAVRERAMARMRGEIFSHQYDVKLQRKDGSHFDGEINARAVTVKGEPGVRVWVRDVSKRKRLEEVQRRLATAIEQSADAIVITDTQGNVEYVNPAHERITGYTREEVLGSLALVFKERDLNPEPRQESFDSLAGGSGWSGRTIGRRKDGTLYNTDVSISPVRDPRGKIANFVGLERDVTQEIQLQNQLFQSQKMEAVGTLAGGIAHDFNNLLTVVQGFSELLLAEKDQKHPEYADLKKIFHAAQSGAELVKRLLMFSRKSEPKPVPMKLNKQIVQVEKLLRHTIPKMIDIRLDLSSDLPDVNADPSQIEQVLMNLAVNARDAMPDKGKLTVRTDIVTLDEEYCGLHIEANPGEYVVLEVSDTGHGMDKETVEHIFDPFFTTKEMGRGTGLGLAMVYGIVTQHNGHITVYSEVGKGTTFRVYLPAIEGEVETDVETTRIMPAFGTETVLLVDDEEFVRELGARILTKHGYTVLQAVNGKEGLDLFKKERSQVSLVILDLIMPEMGGTECLKELLKINPNVKVLVASGYSADASVKETIQMGAKGFVTKPFRFKELLQTVRNVLDGE